MINTVNLNADERAVAIKKLDELLFAASDLRKRIHGGALDEEMAGVLPSLIESHFCDAAKLIGYESRLAKEKEERHAEIRAANIRIRNLEERMANAAPIDGLKSMVESLKRSVYDWWKNEGFTHLSEFRINQWGNAEFELSFMVETFRGGLFSNTPISDQEKKLRGVDKLLAEGVEMEREEKYSDYWDVFDTPNNRYIIEAKLKNRFPSAAIFETSSHKKPQSDGVYTLKKMKAFIRDLQDIGTLDEEKQAD